MREATPSFAHTNPNFNINLGSDDLLVSIARKPATYVRGDVYDQTNRYRLNMLSAPYGSMLRFQDKGVPPTLRELVENSALSKAQDTKHRVRGQSYEPSTSASPSRLRIAAPKGESMYREKYQYNKDFINASNVANARQRAFSKKRHAATKPPFEAGLFTHIHGPMSSLYAQSFSPDKLDKVMELASQVSSSEKRLNAAYSSLQPFKRRPLVWRKRLAVEKARQEAAQSELCNDPEIQISDLPIPERPGTPPGEPPENSPLDESIRRMVTPPFVKSSSPQHDIDLSGRIADPGVANVDRKVMEAGRIRRNAPPQLHIKRDNSAEEIAIARKCWWAPTPPHSAGRNKRKPIVKKYRT